MTDGPLRRPVLCISVNHTPSTLNFGTERKCSLASLTGIRLLAADYDGTLAKRGRLPADLKALLDQVLGCGRKFAIVTGRPFPDLVELLANSGITAAQGFPHVLICEERDIYFLEADGYHALEPHNSRAYMLETACLPQSRALALDLQAQWSRLCPAEVVPAGEGLQVELSSEVAQGSRGFVEIRFAHPDLARRGLAYLEQRLTASGVSPLVAVRNGLQVGLRHQSFGKGRILDLLRQHLCLEAHEVMAVGDSGNDLSMLDGSHGFRCAAVGNADLEVRAAVDAADGVLLTGMRSEGVRELISMIGWDIPQEVELGRTTPDL